MVFLFWPDDGAVLDVDEFNLGAGRGRGRSSLSGSLRKGWAGKKKARQDCDRRPSRSPYRRSPMILAGCPVISPPRRQSARLSAQPFEPTSHNDLLSRSMRL